MTTVAEVKEKKLKLIVDKIHNLPTPPIVFTQITKVINNPDTSAYEIGNIISEDPALTAKILKLTNSSFYGIPRTITNVKQAIVILGLEAVKSLVISASVFETFSRNKLDTDYLEDFWRHSLSVAFMAKLISRVKKIPSLLESEMAFSAGLLHDIGKLIIISHLPIEHNKIKEIYDFNTDISEYEAETQVLGFSHADLGSFMAGKWNLPENICQAILNHHTEKSATTENETALVHLADYLARKLDAQTDESDRIQTVLFEEVWECVGVNPSEESNLINMLREEYSKAETFLKMAQGVG